MRLVLDQKELGSICGSWGVYAGAGEYMRELGSTCGSWGVYAGAGEYMRELVLAGGSRLDLSWKAGSYISSATELCSHWVIQLPIMMMAIVL